MESIEIIKKQIIGILTRWLLKIAGGFFLSIGLENGSVELIATAIVTIVSGIIISIAQGKTLADADPKEFQKGSK